MSKKNFVIFARFYLSHSHPVYDFGRINRLFPTSDSAAGQLQPSEPPLRGGVRQERIRDEAQGLTERPGRGSPGVAAPRLPRHTDGQHTVRGSPGAAQQELR
jgi:hypothetical protein